MGDLVSFLLERLLIQVVSDANRTRNDEVHLQHFLFFIENELLLVLVAEIARHEAKSDIIHKLAVFVLLRVEENAEVVENVVKQVVHYNTSLNATRQCINELIIFLDLVQAVVRPVVLEMLVYLPVQTVWKWFVLPESSQQCHPVVQLESFFFHAQVPIESRNNLNKARHNEGKESNTCQHNDYA